MANSREDLTSDPGVSRLSLSCYCTGEAVDPSRIRRGEMRTGLSGDAVDPRLPDKRPIRLFFPLRISGRRGLKDRILVTGSLVRALTPSIISAVCK